MLGPSLPSPFHRLPDSLSYLKQIISVTEIPGIHTLRHGLTQNPGKSVGRRVVDA